MLTLTQGNSNELKLSLSETQTLSSPVFLFEFISDQTLGKYTCIAADSSAYPQRYNQFTIVEKSSPDPLLGEIELEATGYYTYNVYEQTSTTNLDPASATTLLETGKARVEFDGDRKTTLFNEYNIDAPQFNTYDVIASKGILPPAPPSGDPANYQNSDGSFTQVIASGGTYIAPDITVTDSDGSTFTTPANKDVTCTPPTASGIHYKRPIYTGWRTSFANYDDAWQAAAGTYDYTPPAIPVSFAALDVVATFPFHTLKENNAFGNKFRFTDENGEYYSDPFDDTTKSDPNAFSTDYVIDHLTGLGWKRTPESDRQWATGLSLANSSTHAGYSGYRMANLQEMMTLSSMDNPDMGSGRKGVLNFFPFNDDRFFNYYTSTVSSSGTRPAETYYPAAGSAVSLAITVRNRVVDPADYWIVRNHYT